MAYVYNALSGEFDNINPLSTMSSSGDLQLGNPGITSKDFYGAEGVKYYAVAGSAGGFTLPNIGQPIPIGMGLTMLYSTGYARPGAGAGAKTGQPIPVGMGLTITYGKDVN